MVPLCHYVRGRVYSHRGGYRDPGRQVFSPGNGGGVHPQVCEKRWIPGIVITSAVFTFFWGYLVYTGNISTIWPLFGMSNQLLASSALIIGTTMIMRMNKVKYAWITAVPGILMAFITMYAGYLNVVDNYLPKTSLPAHDHVDHHRGSHGHCVCGGHQKVV